jgi:hypothetical protein
MLALELMTSKVPHSNLLCLSKIKIQHIKWLKHIFN